MTAEELKSVLAQRDRNSRKALSRWVMEQEEENKERCAQFLSEGIGGTLEPKLYSGFRRALLLSRCAMVLAVIVIIGAYLISDFGFALVEGIWNRYCMALGIILAMSLFAGGSILVQNRKEQLIARCYLAQTEAGN